jgi:hypothetical protein
MLRIDPTMLDRLAELESDLLARKARAEGEGWLGEIEGIDLTLSCLEEKCERAAWLDRKQPIYLGSPSPSIVRRARR